MTIWEISEKADYIADRHRQQQEQWHIYCNSLVQGSPVEGPPASRDELRAGQRAVLRAVRPFSGVRRPRGRLQQPHHRVLRRKQNGGDKYLIAQATLAMDGTVDGRISNRSRDRAGALSGDYRHRL